MNSSIRNSRIRRLGVVATIMIVAGACSSSNQSNATSSPGGSTAPTTSAAPVATVPTSSNTTGAPGLAPPPASVLAAANKEGKVVVYTAVSDTTLNKDIAQQFNTAYPKIKVQFVPLGTTILDTRVQTEAQAHAPGSDVFLPDFSSFDATAAQQGYSIPLNQAFPSLRSQYPPAYIYDNGDTAAFVVIENGFSYNRTQVPTADIPKTYSDFAKPFWHGKLCAQDPNQTQSGLYFFAALNQKLGSTVTKQIAANVNPTHWYPTFAPADAAIAAGACAGDLLDVAAADKKYVQQGAPITFVQPSLASGVVIDADLTKGAKHPNAAKVFVSWVLSKPAAKYIASLDKGELPPLIPGEVTPEFQAPQPSQVTKQGLAAVDKLINKYN